MKEKVRAKSRFLSLVGVAIFICIWQAASTLAGTKSVLPGPLAAVSAAIHLLGEGYWRDFLATACRAVVAWLMALGVGIPIGLVLGLSRTLYDSSIAVVAFLRSFPAFMLITIPVALGIGGETARLATITFSSALIIMDECAESLLTLPRDRIDLLHVYRANFWFVLTRLLVFEALGRTIVPAARTTIGICFIVAIVCESLVTPLHGVGARLLTSMSALEMASVYGFLLLTGITGLILNVGIHSLARRMIFWT